MSNRLKAKRAVARKKAPSKAKRFVLPDKSKIASEPNKAKAILLAAGFRQNVRGNQHLNKVYRQIRDAFGLCRSIPLSSRTQLRQQYETFIEHANGLLDTWRAMPLDLRPQILREDEVQATILETRRLLSEWCGIPASEAEDNEIIQGMPDALKEALRSAKNLMQRHQPLTEQQPVQRRDLLLSRMANVWFTLHPSKFTNSVIKSGDNYPGGLVDLAIDLLTFEGAMIAGQSPRKKRRTIGESLYEIRKQTE